MECTQKELAELLGVTPPMVLKYRLAGCPATKRGKNWIFDTVEALQWILARSMERARKREARAEEERARVRLIKTKADLAELRVAKLRESLVSVAEADAVWEKTVRRWTARIEQIIPAGAVVSGMKPAEATAYLKSVIYQTLTDLANGN